MSGSYWIVAETENVAQIKKHTISLNAPGLGSLARVRVHDFSCLLAVQDIEKNLMKQDEDRDARKAKSNQPAAVAQGLELNDASGVRRRGKMMLPAPQVIPHVLIRRHSPGSGKMDKPPIPMRVCLTQGEHPGQYLLHFLVCS
jgi:hypothetical protein